MAKPSVCELETQPLVPGEEAASRITQKHDSGLCIEQDDTNSQSFQGGFGKMALGAQGSEPAIQAEGLLEMGREYFRQANIVRVRFGGPWAEGGEIRNRRALGQKAHVERMVHALRLQKVRVVLGLDQI